MALTKLRQSQLNQSKNLSSISIASDGSLTVSKSIHSISPYSGVTDDLTSISGLVAGQSVTLYLTNPGTDTITIKHGGTISCFGKTDIVLTTGMVDVLSDGTNTYISSGGIPYTRTPASASVTTTATIGVSSSSYTSIPWNSDMIVQGTWHSTTVNNERITPGEIGVYSAMVNVVTGTYGGTYNWVEVRILLNDATIIGGARFTAKDQYGARGSLTSKPIAMNSTDFVNVRAKMYVNGTVIDASPGGISNFSLEKIF